MIPSKPDEPFGRGIYYFDVVAVMASTMIAMGLMRVPSGSRGIVRESSGWWFLLLAVLLLVTFRRRAYTQDTAWIVGAVAALFFGGVTVTFWRWSLMFFIVAIGCSSMLLLAGLVLRTRRVLESLSRSDMFALVAGVMSVCLTWGLTEGAIRLVPGIFNEETQHMLRADPRNYGVADPYIGHLHKPNNTILLSGRDFSAAHHVDALGFRNTWPWPERAEIVAIGDSMTFGYGVEDKDSWPAVLAQSLSPCRIINLGLSGAGPQQYLRIYERFGAKLRPNLLLVGVFAQNDFWDADMFDRWLKSGIGGNFMVWRDFGRPERARFNVQEPVASLESVVRSTVFPVIRSSHLYTVLRALRGGVEAEVAAPPRTFTFADGSRLQLLEDDFLNKSAVMRPGHREFDLLLDALQQIHSLGVQNGAQVLMVLQPGKEQVYLPLLGKTYDDSTSALRSALDQRGIEYLDLGPDFQARAAAGERFFFEVDGHPNRSGYALIAQLVHAHLRKHAERYGLKHR